MRRATNKSSKTFRQSYRSFSSSTPTTGGNSWNFSSYIVPAKKTLFLTTLAGLGYYSYNNFQSFPLISSSNSHFACGEDTRVTKDWKRQGPHGADTWQIQHEIQDKKAESESKKGTAAAYTPTQKANRARKAKELERQKQEKHDAAVQSSNSVNSSRLGHIAKATPDAFYPDSKQNQDAAKNEEQRQKRKSLERNANQGDEKMQAYRARRGESNDSKKKGSRKEQNHERLYLDFTPGTSPNEKTSQESKRRHKGEQDEELSKESLSRPRNDKERKDKNETIKSEEKSRDDRRKRSDFSPRDADDEAYLKDKRERSSGNSGNQRNSQRQSNERNEGNQRNSQRQSNERNEENQRSSQRQSNERNEGNQRNERNERNQRNERNERKERNERNERRRSRRDDDEEEEEYEQGQYWVGYKDKFVGTLKEGMGQLIGSNNMVNEGHRQRQRGDAEVGGSSSSSSSSRSRSSSPRRGGSDDEERSEKRRNNRRKSSEDEDDDEDEQAKQQRKREKRERRERKEREQDRERQERKQRKEREQKQGQQGQQQSGQGQQKQGQQSGQGQQKQQQGNSNSNSNNKTSASKQGVPKSEQAVPAQAHPPQNGGGVATNKGSGDGPIPGQHQKKNPSGTGSPAADNKKKSNTKEKTNFSKPSTLFNTSAVIPNEDT